MKSPSIADELLSKLRKDSTAQGGKGSSKMEKYTIPEITTDDEWMFLTGQITNVDHFTFNPIKDEQILLIDVYSAWSGPCSAMEGHLRRMRLSFVETPDALALAKACCDKIEALKSFQSDPRPTFLFWARGKPVALLRGANRPLLTRLIEQEVDIEAKKNPRGDLEIDFKSGQVIQCQGDLALLAEDEVVHSIGSGLTDKLTSFFSEQPVADPKRARTPLPSSSEPEEAQPPSTPKPLELDPDSNVGDGTKESGSGDHVVDEGIEKSDNEENHDPNENTCDIIDQTTDAFEAKEEEEDQVVSTTAESGVNVEDVPDPGFGKKKSKSGKKPQTGLLKEILNAKPSASGGRR
ncbi:hypothetical protein TCAL_07575 [Tigriopus californicus]|uniref:Thioredoxin domain-containing protein n=2 Tax=Tigriopus californicus TaxID=6832 RepID=A0A553PKG9_TIGCA|nr:hypothetical protein TCAL_07575 [Tigriopus californicus]